MLEKIGGELSDWFFGERGLALRKEISMDLSILAA